MKYIIDIQLCINHKVQYLLFSMYMISEDHERHML